MNPVIHEFLEGRKQEKLKKGGAVEAVEQQFHPLIWIGDAARRASRLRFVTHPVKFSHPEPKSLLTTVSFQGQRQNDGYLRSGNVLQTKSAFDVVGDAAALDVYGFLMLVLEDGRTVLDHFEDSSMDLRQQLEVDEATFEQWRNGFRAIKESSTMIQSNGQVKQVYFPVEEGYHLLSVLSPSLLMNEQLQRLWQMKHSEEAKAAREARKKGEYHPTGFADLAGLLTQRFGGTKPQNISKINSNNGGEVWLIPALPPTLSAAHVPLPKRDFFQSLWVDEELKELFNRLHRLMQLDYNNLAIREGRKEHLARILEWILRRALRLQQQPAGWSDREGFSLPLEQRQWLDAAYIDSASDEGRQALALDLSRWIVIHYRTALSGREVELGETEIKAFAAEIDNYIQNKQEFIG